MSYFPTATTTSVAKTLQNIKQINNEIFLVLVLVCANENSKKAASI